jgi:enamine deaminase RidA (YjgF/YER057c/UK114 family)
MSEDNGGIRFVDVPGWPRPRGYSNGVVAPSGRTLYIAGQIGWNEQQVFAARDFAGQFAQALDNVLAVVRAAGGRPESVVKMTVYVTDLRAYRDAARALGAVWRDRFGKHYPVMALVGVAGLVEESALLEIETTALLPETAT